MMGARTEPGWYYVGDGKLRYRDEFGWTSEEMDTRDDRAAEWPPPSPEQLQVSLQGGQAQRVPPGRRAKRLSHLLRRTSSAGRHRGA